MKSRVRMAIVGAGVCAAVVASAPTTGGGVAGTAQHTSATATPIKHLVVIFQENVSFDHYFAHLSAGARTRPASRPFVAAAGTPPVNGLNTPLLTEQPQPVQSAAAGSLPGASPATRTTSYTDEQKASTTA